MAKVVINQVANGYIVEVDPYRSEVYTTLDEVFERLLLRLEGRAPSFIGDLHGRVVIERVYRSIANPK